MPYVSPLKKFITFVAICLKYFSVFSAFSACFTVFCICACADYGKIPNVLNLPDYPMSIMVAKYFHKFYIFPKFYFKES